LIATHWVRLLQHPVLRLDVCVMCENMAGDDHNDHDDHDDNLD
jgi:hypothetical protein